MAFKKVNAVCLFFNEYISINQEYLIVTFVKKGGQYAFFIYEHPLTFTYSRLRFIVNIVVVFII